MDEAGRHRIRPAIRVTAGIGIPFDFHDEVVLTVVIERRIEVKPEPGGNRTRDVLRAAAVHLDRRVARVIIGKIVGERRQVSMAAPEFEIIERTRTAFVDVPFPSRYLTCGYGVRRQNQSLAPHGIDASTSPEGVHSVRTLAAHGNGIRERRTGSQRA